MGGKIKTRLELVKEAIPLITNLHTSFWGNSRFLGWQLLRLNINYQKEVDILWKKWSRLRKSKGQERGEPFSGYEIIQKDYPPDPGQTFEDWQESALDLAYGYLVHVTVPGVNIPEISKQPDIGPPVIPWAVRFPAPNYLNTVPPWPPREKTIKGRPTAKWALNPLVFELSQAGMKDMEIARRLFGIKKSTERYPQKHPTLVRIANIKKAAEMIVLQTYPLS